MSMKREELIDRIIGIGQTIIDNAEEIAPFPDKTTSITITASIRPMEAPTVEWTVEKIARGKVCVTSD